MEELEELQEGDEDGGGANERGLFNEAEADAAVADLREPPPTGTLRRVPPLCPIAVAGTCSGQGSASACGGGGGWCKLALPLWRRRRPKTGPAYARACLKACLLLRGH
ncbi:hypothetical protein NL676_008827 [Syzygium grande]|nr:hypothetical protein NL676_008827 [Syzygium grande]